MKRIVITESQLKKVKKSGKSFLDFLKGESKSVEDNEEEFNN